MADDLLSPAETVEFYRWCVVLYALYENKPDLAVAALPGFEVQLWKHLPEYELPSHAVLRKAGHVLLIVAGTTNGWQGGRHATGGYVGWNYKNGGVNSMWWNTTDRMREKIGAYLPLASAHFTKLTTVGHSYGAALAQIMADRHIDDGEFPEMVDTWAIASPKPFTDWVGEPRHSVRILLGDQDPVTVMPPAAVRAIYTDPFTSLAPIPNPFDSWAHRGKAVWIRDDGSISEDWTHGLSDPSIWKPLDFSSHYISNYASRIITHRERRGLPETAEIKRLRALLKEAGGDEGAILARSLTWHPGFPNNPWWGLLPDPVFSASKGSPPMANAVKVSLHFRMKRFGWQEQHTYYDANNTRTELATVLDRVHTLVKARVKVLAPRVIYGTHFDIECIRLTRQDGYRESLVLWDPVIPGLDKGSDNPGADAGTDYPWTGFLCRLRAGGGISRTLLVRPIWDGLFLTKDGSVANSETITGRLKTMGQSYLAQNCWHIKAQNREDHPDKLVTGITMAPSPIGGTLLSVPDHGYLPGQKIRVHGGEPWHKPFRDEYIVGQGTSEDAIHLLPVLTQGPVAGGCKVYRVEYKYYPITAFEPVRMRSRDTGNGIVQERGRR